MRTLATLVRIRDRDLNDRSARLSELQANLSRVTDARAELRRMRVEDARVDLPEAMPYLAGYLAGIHREDARAEAAERDLSDLVDRQRAEVLEVWRDMRSLEHLREVSQARSEEAEAQREVVESDERNIIAHGRATGSTSIPS